MKRKYQTYKPSGIEWIGEIPENWNSGKMKYVLSNNDGGVWGDDVEDEEEGTFVVRSTEITIDGNWDLSQILKRNLTDNEISKCKLFEGDLVITKSSGSPQHIGKSVIVSKEIEDLNCCYSNFVQRIRFKNYHPKLYHYILNSEIVREQFKYLTTTSTGLGNLNGTSLNDVLLPFIPLSEQHQIVQFLDSKTELIDELISTKERKITLLKEQRTSLINQVVTKGLNPNVKMKDSGVEWIGEIPEHWEVGKLKHICKENFKSLSNNTNPNFELDYIEISDVDSDGNIKNTTHYTFSESPSRCRRIVSRGDIILSTVRTYLRSIGLIENEVSDLICSTGFSVLTPNYGVYSKHLFYMVRTEWFISMVI
jgi:type I restriction enzyme S subunit